MTLLIPYISTILLLVLNHSRAYARDFKILEICDRQFSYICDAAKTANQSFTLDNNVNISYYTELNGNYFENLKALEKLQMVSWDAVVSLGKQDVVHAANTFAKAQNIPAFIYDISPSPTMVSIILALKLIEFT